MAFRAVLRLHAMAPDLRLLRPASFASEGLRNANGAQTSPAGAGPPNHQHSPLPARDQANLAESSERWRAGRFYGGGRSIEARMQHRMGQPDHEA